MLKKFKTTSLIAAAVLAFGVFNAPAALAAKDVTVAVPIAVDSLDPYNTNSTLSMAVGKSYYEGLFAFDKDLKIVNLLATGYDVSADGMTYTIKLKHGVKFQDGTDFNADAVKANLDRVMDKANHLARFSQFNRIKTVEPLDPYTVKITLTEPFSPFINSLAHPSAMMISPTALKKYGKDIAFHPVGTGPFEFVDWKPSEYLKVKKFAGYWDKTLPKIDTLTFRTVTDNNTRAAVVQTGEAQFVYPVPYEQAEILKKNAKLDVVVSPSISVKYVTFNVLEKPFDQLKVREAINYAINKKALIKVAFGGYGDTMNGVVPTSVDYGVEMKPWPYDPAKAKALLKEAGYPNGFTSTLWSAYNDGTSVKVVQFLQQQLAQVGIKVSLQVLESGQRVQQVQQVQSPKEAKVRMLYQGWSSSTGEADWALRPLLDSHSWPPVLNNTAYYKNAKVDGDIAKALVITDRAQKAAIYKDAQELVWKDAPWAFLAVPSNISAKSKKLSGMYTMPDGSFYFRDIDLKP
jgi:glutathione transport system substrate-binding protein